MIRSIKFHLISNLIFLYSPLFCMEKQPIPLSLKVSVIIPCHKNHAQYLPSLLDFFKEQTVLPDEIVISLSEYQKAPEGLVESINSTFYPFPVVLLLFKEPISEGGNRNHACVHAKGDLLICQDADDIPHTQRIEIIKWFFETYKIDHLRHTLAYNKDGLAGLVNPEEIFWQESVRADQCYSYCSLPYSNGAVAISRRVFDKVKWDESFLHGNDVEFNIRVYENFENVVVLECPLYVWRTEFSSYQRGK